MADKPMDVYLNDHLGGAIAGSALAEQIHDRSKGTPLEAVTTKLAAEIEEDRETLLGLMKALDVSRNPIKQVTGWLAEKASRVKFSGGTSGEPDHGLFMALESLRLGVAGKKCLWMALAQVRDDYHGLTAFDLDALIERAVAQGLALERERLAAGAQVLSRDQADA